MALRWKDNTLRKFEPKDGLLATMEDWRTWTISTLDKLDAMEDAWFVDASESLILEDEQFHFLVAHPAADVTNPPDNAFKTAVVNLAVLHGIRFPTAADNTNPTQGAKLQRNFTNIISRLKAIQSQLSDSCSETMETIFIEEQREKHPLKPMRIWKRMSDSFHKVLAKDRGTYMKVVQNHAGCIPSWELDYLVDWIRKMEELRQDLLKSGHTSAVADDCIVLNLLDTIVEMPTEAPHREEWIYDARAWKSAHEEHSSQTWLILKSKMQTKIRKLQTKEARDESIPARSGKRAKVTTPAGMALQATERLAKAAETFAAAATQQNNQQNSKTLRVRTRQNTKANGKSGQQNQGASAKHNASEKTNDDHNKVDGAGRAASCVYSVTYPEYRQAIGLPLCAPLTGATKCVE
mmetsp:Transcript_54986/g.112326  ORF Transcript_54986/g.112326 Transcript_54986/m.112326 type:complete len:407 (-) Transcript_54986:130-1350(-)|eukprot:CAMPEP_0181312994 /NCGR_PEP_ID=MMETSP1101-20121128/14002_1 /TAXON_ID=46948 /ORGANISM="Rhodomonas abbreviata, Strain Caron Lab Isolate" /LENGTH=406 /DNA_ID=CAMNT_0023419899 /DNA_START=188 /DNA_END=1408 /DNA_ORIENTATION=-